MQIAPENTVRNNIILILRGVDLKTDHLASEARRLSLVHSEKLQLHTTRGRHIATLCRSPRKIHKYDFLFLSPPQNQKVNEPKKKHVYFIVKWVYTWHTRSSYRKSPQQWVGRSPRGSGLQGGERRHGGAHRGADELAGGEDAPHVRGDRVWQVQETGSLD